MRMRGLHRVLNMPEYLSLNMPLQLLNMRAYALAMLNMLEYACIYLNKQSSQYARILNVFDAVHRIKSLYKKVSGYWDKGVFRTLPNI